MEGELDLNNMNTEANKRRYLPLLLKGKAAYYSDSLRATADWGTARSSFLQEFTIDPNVVLGELRALRCVDYDVYKYSEEFNTKA